MSPSRRRAIARGGARRGAWLGIVHTLRVLHAAALSAARCAAGPRTRRDVMIAPPLPTRITLRRDRDIAPYRHYTRNLRVAAWHRAQNSHRAERTRITPAVRYPRITRAHCPWRLATPGGALVGSNRPWGFPTLPARALPPLRTAITHAIFARGSSPPRTTRHPELRSRFAVSRQNPEEARREENISLPNALCYHFHGIHSRYARRSML